MILSLAAAADAATRFSELGLSSIALDLGLFQLRWYSLAYLAGIILGYVYMLKLLAQPGAPMARRHADDMFLYATLGVILGGRLGYIIFYRPDLFATPLEILKLWEGGMSFHGGLIGTVIGMAYLSWRNQLNFLRVCDYVACCVPFGMLFGRLANFVNGELWGRPGDVPWAIVFDNDPLAGPFARHPSQLYEAALEGLLLIIVLAFLFWRTGARYRTGLLTGVFTLGIGAGRFVAEFFREPDNHLQEFAVRTGLSMGQWLTIPLILVGMGLVAWALLRRPVGAVPATSA